MNNKLLLLLLVVLIGGQTFINYKLNQTTQFLTAVVYFTNNPSQVREILSSRNKEKHDYDILPASSLSRNNYVASLGAAK